MLMRIKRRSEARQPTANWKDKVWIPTELPEQFGAVPYFPILADRKKPEARIGSNLAFFQEDYLAYGHQVFTKWPLERGFHITLEVVGYDGAKYLLRAKGTDLSGKEVFKTKHSIKHFVEVKLGEEPFRAQFKFNLKRTISRLSGTTLRHSFDAVLTLEHASITAFLQYLALENFALMRKQEQCFLSPLLVRLKHV